MRKSKLFIVYLDGKRLGYYAAWSKKQAAQLACGPQWKEACVYASN